MIKVAQDLERCGFGNILLQAVEELFVKQMQVKITQQEIDRKTDNLLTPVLSWFK